MAERPTVEISQSGEARIIMETSEERQQRQQKQSQASATQEQGGGSTTMTVADLKNMDVFGADDEDLGSPAAFIEVDGQTYIVLESGGFLGIGEKQVPVPMTRVSLRQDRLMLQQLTEEEIEDADGFEYDNSRELPDDQTVNVSG